MEENKKHKLSNLKEPPSPRNDKEMENLNTKTLSRLYILYKTLDSPQFCDELKINVYEFEKETLKERKVYFQKKKENKKNKIDFKKIILESNLYFNEIKHLPLNFIAKKTDKLIYLEERKLIVRENNDLRIFKKIEKLRKKNELLDEVIFNEEIVKHKTEVKEDSLVLKKIRGYIFKKRRYVLEEALESKNDILKKHIERIKCIMKIQMRRRKENVSKKEYSLHSTILNIINKLGPDIKALQMPIDYLNQKNNKYKIIEAQPKTSPLKTFFENKNRNCSDKLNRETSDQEGLLSNKSKAESENNAQ